MRLSLLVLCVVAVVASVAAASDVVVLTDRTFDEQVGSGTWLVRLFAFAHVFYFNTTPFTCCSAERLESTRTM